MLKRKQSHFFILIILLFLNTLYLSAEESQNLQISFFTMVFTITAHENLEEVNFLTHVPIITENSVPLLVRLSEGPNYNEKVCDFTFKQLREDSNLIRFTLKNCLQDKNTYVAFEVYTLKKISDYSDMPDSVPYSSYSNLPDYIKYYLQPSSSIQSDHQEIKTKAFEFLYGSWLGTDVINILNEIIHFTGKVIKYLGGMQTALNTLRNRYAACTGKANLAVALCRSLGIPARILFVLPTHFITEIWIPDYGWVRGESTLGIFPAAKENSTVLWIANIDDEYNGGDHGGVITIGGIEDKNADASWFPVYDHIYQPGNKIENFATIEGDIHSNSMLFEKGSELWRIFCGLKNSSLTEEKLAIYSGYHKLYLESLVANDIPIALECADQAILEAKRLLDLPNLSKTRKTMKEKWER